MNARALNKLLKERYDIDLLGFVDHDHIMSVYEHYMGKRQSMRQTLGESVMSQSPEYSKVYLITETARQILREIAPRRSKKKSKKKGAK